MIKILGQKSKAQSQQAAISVGSYQVISKDYRLVQSSNNRKSIRHYFTLLIHMNGKLAKADVG